MLLYRFFARFFFVAIFSAILAFSPVGDSYAEERIYIPEFFQSNIYSFSFDGTNFTRHDDELITGGLAPIFIQATDRLFFTGNNSSSVAVSVIEPRTKIELPRPELGIAGSRAMAIFPGKPFAFVANLSSGQPVLKVMDLQAPSTNFLKEVASLPLGSDGSIPNLMTFSPDGDSLYVATTGGTISPYAAVKRVSVTWLAAPDPPALLLEQTVVTTVEGVFPGRKVYNLRSFVAGGVEYVFLTRDQLFSMTVTANVLSDPPAVVTWSDPRCSDSTLGEPRPVDIYAMDVGPDAYAFVTTLLCMQPDDGDPDNIGVCPNAFSGPRELRLDVLELPGFTLSGGTVLHNCGVSGTFDAELNLEPSTSGTYLYAVQTGTGGLAPTVHALDVSTLIGPTPSNALLASTDINPAFTDALPIFNFIVREKLNPLTGGSISSLLVDGGDPSLTALINNTNRPIVANGSALGLAQHAFMGLNRINVSSAFDTQVDLDAPAFIPAEKYPLLLIHSNESVSDFLSPQITVANQASSVSTNLVYASGGKNKIYMVDSANQNDVVEKIDTLTSPGGVAIRADGKILYTTGFFNSTLGVHSIVAHDGFGWNELIAEMNNIGPNPQQLVLNPVSSRNRLYVVNVSNDPGEGSVTILRTTDSIPTIVQTIPVRCPRGIAVSNDGNYLYVAQCNNPHIQVIDISTGSASLLNEVSLTGITTGRADGLAVSADGTKLYFSASGDSKFVRVFDIGTDPENPAETGELTAVPPLAGDISLILTSRDGRYIYVSSRTAGRVDVFDAVTHAHLTQRDTGLLTNGLAESPDSQFLFVSTQGISSVKTLDARTGANHEIIGVTGALDAASLAVSPGVETPPTGGQKLIEESTEEASAKKPRRSVTVRPVQDVKITYPSVSNGGSTTVTSSNVSDFPIPAGFTIDRLPVHYRMGTSATTKAPISVCVTYEEDIDGNGDDFDDEALEKNLRILHEESGQFVDRSSSIKTVDNKMCGYVADLSEFVVARSLTNTVALDVKPGEDPNRIELSQGGKVSVAVLSSSTFDAAGIDPESVVFAGAPVFEKNGVPVTSLEYVNQDSRKDLVLKFSVSLLQLTSEDGSAHLTGELFDDTPFSGYDKVEVKP